MTHDPKPTLVARMLTWLRAGYPHGVPEQDYVALLGVLHHRLTETEVEEIAGELAQHRESGSAGGAGSSADDIGELIRRRAFEHAGADDIARVSARLAAGGWPLAEVHPPEGSVTRATVAASAAVNAAATMGPDKVG